MRKVLITGANGYIAHHLKKILFQDAWFMDQSGPSDIIGCISQIHEHAHRLQEVEIVFHLADQRLQDLNESNLEANILRHQKFIQAIETLPSIKAFIFCSSCSVYGQSLDLISEDSPIHLTSAYAKSKFATEELLRQSQLPWRIARFATAYGLSQPMRYDLLINDLALALKDKNQRDIFGLDAYRAYVHCKDFARALIASVDWPTGTLKNIVESNWSKRAIVKKIQDIARQELPCVLDEERIDSRNYNIKTTSNFSFEVPFEKGLEELINAHLS